MMAPDAGGHDTEVMLNPPYVASMGWRQPRPITQIADIRVERVGEWIGEPITLSVEGPYSQPPRTLDRTTTPREGGSFGVRMGTPGEWRITFAGETSGCRTGFDITVEVDEVLREYDRRSGLTQPPPVSRP